KRPAQRAAPDLETGNRNRRSWSSIVRPRSCGHAPRMLLPCRPSLFPSARQTAMHLDQPLSDKEFDELDKFLLSDRTADDCMTMDALHGYLTALAIGPEEVPLVEWLPPIWGTDEKAAPKFKTEKEYERIIGL